MEKCEHQNDCSTGTLLQEHRLTSNFLNFIAIIKDPLQYAGTKRSEHQAGDSDQRATTPAKRGLVRSSSSCALHMQYGVSFLRFFFSHCSIFGVLPFLRYSGFLIFIQLESGVQDAFLPKLPMIFSSTNRYSRLPIAVRNETKHRCYSVLFQPVVPAEKQPLVRGDHQSVLL